MRGGSIKRLLNIPKQQHLTRLVIAGAAANVKARIVAARRNGDDRLAAELSQLKEVVKRTTFSNCSVCGVALKKGSQRCYMHSIPFRRRKRLSPVVD